MVIVSETFGRENIMLGAVFTESHALEMTDYHVLGAFKFGNVLDLW